MKYRKLGRTNFEVSEIGYGAWGIGGTMWVGAADKESIRALRRAIGHGVNLIDTALVYGNGHSEELVGRAITEEDKPVYVATKVPPKNKTWPAAPGIAIEEVFPRDYIMQCADDSLRNLRLDRIDLLQLHVWNPDWLGHGELARAFEDLKTQGKVRAVGISINDHQPDTALSIIETGTIDAVQVIYNIFDQTPERKLFPACIKHDIGVLVRVPLDEGALTGRIDETTTFPEGDFRNHYFRGDRKKQVIERVNALVRDLEMDDATDLPTVALRFCLSHPAVSTVIPGMRSVTSVDNNVSVPGLGPLPSGTLEVLRRHAWDRDFYH